MYVRRRMSAKEIRYKIVYDLAMRNETRLHT